MKLSQGSFLAHGDRSAARRSCWAASWHANCFPTARRSASASGSATAASACRACWPSRASRWASIPTKSSSSRSHYAQELFNTESLFRILVEARSRNAIEPAKAAISHPEAAPRRRGRRHRHHPGRGARHLRPHPARADPGRGGIAAISLAVAGILVMNVMLVAVAQRTSEIGLLKAIGAPAAEIRRLFFAEALLAVAGRRRRRLRAGACSAAL